MQRILNDPDNIVDEMLSGFLKANENDLGVLAYEEEKDI